MVALISMLVLPDFPSSSTSSHLTSLQHDFVIWRLQKDTALLGAAVEDVTTVPGDGDEKKISVWEAFRMLLADGKVWIFCGVMMSTYTAAGVINFFPSVVQTLGYSRNITLLLSAPPYLLCCIVVMFNGLHSDKTRERFKHVAYPLVVALFALIVALSTTATAPRYLAMMLLPSSLSASIIITHTWMWQTLGQIAAKRAAGIALLNTAGNIANIWTPYLYTDPPRYLLAFSVNIVAVLLAIMFSVLIRWHLKRLNEEEERGGRKAQYIL